MAHELPPLFRNPICRSENRLCGSGAEANQDLRFHDGQLDLKPGSASLDFRTTWFLVDAAFSAFFKLEVLDGIGYKNGGSVDPRFLQCTVKQSSRRSDERPAKAVFFVSRLFAD